MKQLGQTQHGQVVAEHEDNFEGFAKWVVTATRAERPKLERDTRRGALTAVLGRKMAGMARFRRSRPTLPLPCATAPPNAGCLAQMQLVLETCVVCQRSRTVCHVCAKHGKGVPHMWTNEHVCVPGPRVLAQCNAC